VLSDHWFICRYRGYEVDLRGAQVWSDWIGDASQEALPKSVGLSMDATSAARSAIKLSFSVTSGTAGRIAQGLDVVAQVAEKGLDVANGMYQESVETANYNYEQKQMLLALQQLVRQEGPLRLELTSLAEAVNQSQGYYLAARRRR
jgi:hypothetical protein